MIEYRLIAFQNEFGMGSVAINNEIANSIGLNEEQLYQLSMKNTEKVFPVSFQNLTTLTEGIQKMDKYHQDMRLESIKMMHCQFIH